jgi:hypothetical protein
MIATAVQPKTGRGAGHVALLVAGGLAGLLALALIAAGGVLLYAHGSKRDEAGFYATGDTTIGSPTYAFVSEGLELGADGPDWLFRQGRLGSVRVTASGATGHAVFVGIGRKAQVEAYLRTVAHERVTDFEVDPFSLESQRQPGNAAPPLPAAQIFWAAKAIGTGRQSLEWPVEKGSWDVVVMNADATRGVRADVSVGAKVPLILWLGIGLLCAGGLVAVGSCVLTYLGARRPAA